MKVNKHIVITLLCLFLFSLIAFSQSLSINELKNKANSSSGLEKAQYQMQLALKLLDNNIEDANKFAEKALDIAQKNKSNSYIANAKIICAQIYKRQKKYSKVIDFTTSASSLFLTLNDKTNYAFSESLKGEALMKVKSYQKAIVNLKNSFTTYKNINKDTKTAYVSLDIAECYEKTDNFTSTIKWYKTASNYFNKAGKAKNEVSVLILLATIYNNYGDYENSEKELKKALKKASLHKLESKINTIKIKLETIQKNKSVEENQTVYEKIKEQEQNDYIENIENTSAKSLEEIEKLSAKNQLIEYKIKAQRDDYEKKILIEKLNLLEVEEKLQKEKLQKEKISLELSNEKLIVEKSTAEKQRLIILIVTLSVIVVLIFIGFIVKRKSNIQLYKKNKQIVNQKGEIERKSKHIDQSINYAQKIQYALLPNVNILSAIFKDSFVYLKPKNKVSGDFFWIHPSNDYISICVADCTGHGVPGAFMSIVFNNILEQIVKDNKSYNPKEILETSEKYLIEKIQNKKTHGINEFKDGMDASFIQINKATNTLLYCGAKNPIYIISKGELIELKATKRSIETIPRKNSPEFELISYELKKGDVIYMFSDGFPDQKGGKSRKKFYYPPFKDFLVKISGEKTEKQKEIIHETFNNWKKNEEQIDDVLIVGIKYS